MQNSVYSDRLNFLAGPAIDPLEIESRYPNAKRILRGGLFISHDGRDFSLIRETIVHPVVIDRFMDGFFLHNRESGGSSEYREFVRTALHYLDKFLLVVTANSICNEWVQAEVSVALDLARPIVLCVFDDSDPMTIHRDLGNVPWYRRFRRRLYSIDFRSSPRSAQLILGQRLDQMLARSPYDRNYWKF